MHHDTTPVNEQEKTLIEKVRALSPDKVSQVLDFVDFLSHKDNERRLIRASNKLAEPVFKKSLGQS